MNEPTTSESDLLIARLAKLVLELGSEQEGESARKERSFARTQILLHAMAVFNRQGLEATAVQDILDAAQISRRTFYKYFSGKLDVLASLYVLSCRVLLARTETELALADSREDLIRKLIGICFDYQYSLGRIIGIMVEEAMRSASPLAPQRRQLQQGMMDLLLQHLRRLDCDLPDSYMLLSLVLAVEGCSLQVLTQTPEAGQAEIIRRCREQMVLLWERAL